MTEAIPTPDVQTCPRRMGEPGPWEYKPGLDSWVADRWTADEEVDRREDEEFRAKYPPPSSRGSRLWKWSWGPPRTCDFCGGVHPEDAIRLVAEGWEVEGTGKLYKRYLNPPGTAAKYQATLASIRDRDREPSEGVPSVWSPTPPVKLYVMHLSDDQVRRFNEAIDGREG